MCMLPEANCETCDVAFDPDGYEDVQVIDGWTKREWMPTDDMNCVGCKGHGDCEGTFGYDNDGKYKAIPCHSDRGRTRFCAEDDGGKTRLGVYCDTCWKFYEDDE